MRSGERLAGVPRSETKEVWAMRCRRCNHRRVFHQHHHARTYCSQCSCLAYAPWWRLRVRDVPDRPLSGGHRVQRDATQRAAPGMRPDIVEPGTGVDHGETGRGDV
jgi:hypothetical protein